MTLKDRFRTAVAMWIFVGLLGGPFMMLLGGAAIAAAGPFADRTVLEVDATLPAGQETDVRTNDGIRLSPGDFMVLAQPATVDPADVTCTWKSQVYSTGNQRSGTLEPSPVQGYADVVTDPTTGTQYRTVLTTARGTGWMEPKLLTCTGADSFALASDDGLSDAMRPVLGAVGAVFGALATALGFGALALTRHWRRQDATTPPAPARY